MTEAIHGSISENQMNLGSYVTEERKPMKKDQSFRKILTQNIKEDSSTVLQDQRGIFAMLTAIALVVIFGFLILGFEVGKWWYIVKAEMSKTVDAASLLAATHQGNPSLDEYYGEGEGLQELVRAAGEANFQEGWYGAKAPTLTLARDAETGTVRVEAKTIVANQFAGIFDKPKTAIGATGTTQKRDVEIMLVLDRSKSMGGSFDDLKEAAQNFVQHFKDTEENDKIGLLSFHRFVREEVPLDINFFIEMDKKILALGELGWGTNIEDALDQAGSKFTVGDNIQKYIIFFSDGAPTAFRANKADGPFRTFTRYGHEDPVNEGDTIVKGTSLWNPENGEDLGVDLYQTGDGSSSTCDDKPSTLWEILKDPVYGASESDSISEFHPEQCKIKQNKMRKYMRETARKMAIEHAREIKEDKGILIYAIGLGSIKREFLLKIASGKDFTFLTPNSNELNAIFQTIAKTIKLTLVS